MNLSFSWELEHGDALPDDGRFLGLDTDTLTIIPTQESDEGSYRCAVTNPAGTVDSDNAYLTVCKF